ncbi:MAG TPA: hypothetical protein VES70_03045 [Pseudomonas sp.]|nr:hypothetical protein [Pseudomonas sp.]
MKVRALRIGMDVSPSLGTDRRREFPINVGHEYLVYTVACIFEKGEYHGLTPYGVEDEFGRLIPVPSWLFEIIDPRASRYWVVTSDEGSFYMRPREFVDNEYLSDDIHEDLPGARATLQEIKARLEAEGLE